LKHCSRPARTRLTFSARMRRPSSLDAAVYAHLAAVRHREAGQWVLAAAPSLPAYFVRMQQRLLAAPLAAAAAALNSACDPNSASDAAAEQAALAGGCSAAEAAFAPVGAAATGAAAAAAASAAGGPAGGGTGALSQVEVLVAVRNMLATLALFAAAAGLLTLALRQRA
jgi:hypothetical protein